MHAPGRSSKTVGRFDTGNLVDRARLRKRKDKFRDVYHTVEKTLYSTQAPNPSRTGIPAQLLHGCTWNQDPIQNRTGSLPDVRVSKIQDGVASSRHWVLMLVRATEIGLGVKGSEEFECPGRELVFRSSQSGGSKGRKISVRAGLNVVVVILKRRRKPRRKLKNVCKLYHLDSVPGWIPGYNRRIQVNHGPQTYQIERPEMDRGTNLTERVIDVVGCMHRLRKVGVMQTDLCAQDWT
ncbi:hypothetical protein DFH06DRAFT_1363892 [Mycena polygramma]|nr:hypothetical protein DFH06DRAFT_1363892 [Mycena polygramma]